MKPKRHTGPFREWPIIPRCRVLREHRQRRLQFVEHEANAKKSDHPAPDKVGA